MKAKTTIFLKCILAGIIYAFVTCIVQVPVANALFSIFDIQSDSKVTSTNYTGAFENGIFTNLTKTEFFVIREIVVE